MDLQQCWTKFLQAEQFMQQGHWSHAQYLFKEVLTDLPSHIEAALHDEDVKPCQFSCLLRGLKDASVFQSEILNKLGYHHQAYETLNTVYGQCQFWAMDDSEIISNVTNTLEECIDSLYSHLVAFFKSKKDEPEWLQHLEVLQRAHHNFGSLKATPYQMSTSRLVS